MTDPKKFLTSDNLRELAQGLDSSDLRLAADFRINKWDAYTRDDCVLQDQVLSAMQARGEVWYVEDIAAVYFIAGSLEAAVLRLEEAWEDLAA